MYSLTVNFSSIEELQEYLKGKATTLEMPADVPPVIDEKKPAPKKAAPKKAAPKVEVQAEEVFEEVESPFVEPEVVVDREKAIATAQKLVGQLKATGIADADLMPAIHEVYSQAGCPINLKISQLEDSQLAKFIPLFEAKVSSIVAKSKAPTANASFI
jgi:hypothetical protein